MLDLNLIVDNLKLVTKRAEFIWINERDQTNPIIAALRDEGYKVRVGGNIPAGKAFFRDGMLDLVTGETF